ncbi:BRO family protein [Vreelandella olivaria]|uniref:BRO family protein n=1 Tax=Vreelandella olivaria TaxID=390919 RepID=UPI00201F323E|nr:BRO family protein [Halomonas olivaria]
MNHSTATAEILPFRFETREVRTLLIDDQPWFCASDICHILGYRNSRDALAKHCRTESIEKYDTPSVKSDVAKRDITSRARRSQAMTFINEGNLYRLIIKSRKEEALRFESWVCDEVLPAIRKHGHYRDAEGRMNTLIGQTIGTDGFHCLAAVVEGRLRRYPKATQQRTRSHLWSQVRKAFGVSRGEDIPASQLDAARQFIAAYALEGEWLPASPCTPVDAPLPLPDTPDEADYVNLKSLCHHMLQIRELYRHYHLYDALTQLGSPAGKRLYGHVVDGAAIAQRYQSRLQPRLH